ncbi:hypothetical protein EE612_051881, partial [Oryza sativa]
VNTLDILISADALLVKIHNPVFLWKVYGFSALLQRGALAAKSAAFHCSGYNWFLKVSPMHKTLGDGTPHVALSLVLSRLSFKPDYTMNAVFVLSMYNHSKGNFLVVKASYNFDVKNTHSRNICLISLEDQLKSSEYLLDDTCVLGVEILQIDVCRSLKKKNVKVQRFSSSRRRSLSLFRISSSRRRISLKGITPGP